MKIFTKSINYHKIALAFILLISAFAQAQLQKSFTPRFNEAVNGDFTIIANNMISTTTTGSYTGGSDNHLLSNLVYVDIDGNTGIGSSTFNSSSANFVNPTLSTSCLTIKKAFLYWAASDREQGNGDDNQPSWNYNDVNLMLPGETSYTTYTATGSEIIYRGRDTHFSNEPYICVKEITTEVIGLTDPYGTYQVANVEGKTGSLSDHNGTNIGVSGGWQIVFIYESPLLPLKNISIFDGYAHVNAVGGYDIDFNGFQTVPTGNVNANVLIGALEGDQSLGGDRLQIENTSSTFVDISTTNRAADNFFNSRITIDDANFVNRTPASTNTLGFDAAVFQLSNPGNSIIGNNQTSATIRLMSNLEVYGLYLLGLSVDVWEPDLSLIQLTLDTSTTTFNPGAIFGANFSIENKGNDDARDLEVSTTLPPQVLLVEPISPALPTGVTYNYNPITNLLEFFVADGVADAGAAAVDVEFDLQIRDECYFLETNCDLDFELQLAATYTGDQNPVGQSTVSSANLDACGVGILDPVNINVNQPTISWQTPVGNLDRTIQCGDASGLATAQALEPSTNKCNLTLAKTSGIFVTDSGCLSTGTYTNTWNFTDACGSTILNFTQTITVVDTTAPVIDNAAGDLDTNLECSDAAGIAAALALAPTATDDCSAPAINIVSDDTTVDPNCANAYVRVRVWNFTDGCGNTSPNFTQTITVVDTNAPDIDNTAGDLDANLECSDAAGIAAALALAPTATDNCTTPTINIVSDDTTVDPNCANAYVRVRVWNFTDGCGNTSPNFTQTITVVDTNAPDIDNTAGDLDANLECSDAAGIAAALALAPTATDNCTTPTINIVSDDTTVDPNCANAYVRVRVWNFTDGCGNTSPNFTQTITVVDTNAPVIDNTAGDLDANLECSDAAGIAAALALAPTATDDCSAPAINIVSDDTTVDPNCANAYVRVRVWNFTDGCGNTSPNFTQTITVVDTNAPDIDNTAGDLDANLECSDAAGIAAALALAPTATDNCTTPTINIVSDDTTVDPNCANAYVRVRVWNFTDGCGNTSPNFTQTITVVDTNAPVIDNTAGDLDANLECSDAAGIAAALALAPTATDNCTTPTINIVSDDTTVDPNCANAYVRVRVWNFTDGCGNTSPNFTQTITVVDTNAPDIDNTAGDLDANLECSDAAGIAAALALAPTATDNCTTPTINIVSDDTTVDPNCANAYVRVRVWNFTDGCGNTSPNFTQTITVVDTNVPVIDNTNTNNIEIECGIGDTQTTLTAWLDSNAGATATDNCGTVTWTNDYGLNTSVQCDNGAITVTFTATDECNNQSSTTATYLIKDTTAPVIDNTAGDLDANLECSDAAGIAAALALAPTATDNCTTPTINIVSDDTTVDPNCANAYVRVRVWNFTDGCGNTSPNFTQTITVVDTNAPVIDNTAGDLDANLECSDAAGIAAALALAPTATDNCTTPTINIVSDDTTVDPNCANAYVRVRVWNFTDGCGNTSPNFTQTITVVDTNAPVIDNTAGDLDANLECSDAAGIAAALALAPTATDNCTTPTINIVSDDTTVDPNCANAYVRVRVWNFTDGCGNTSPNFTQTITVVDTNAPVIDNTAGDLDANLECSDAAGIAAALALAPTATDNCTIPTINIVSDDTTVDPNCANAYVRVRVWNFTDGCGNTSPNFTQTITVVDTNVPVIDNTNTNNIEIECGIGDTQTTLTAWLDSNAGATATDNCGTVTWTNDYGLNTSVQCDNGAITVTFTATDECNNQSSTTATYLIKDTTAPVIDNTAGDLDANLECSDAAGIAAALALAPTATDDCSAPAINIVSDDTTVDPNCANAYVRVRVWNFTDGCGNTSPNFTQTITVVDTNAPDIDNTAGDLDANLECSDAAGIAAALALAPTATDNCTTPTINIVSDDTTVDPNCANAYVRVRVWNFTDGCGNTSPNFTQTITVVDTNAPVIDNTAGDLDANLECSDAAGIAAALALAPTATDNCTTPTINIVSDDTTVDPNCANAYVRVRVWNFTDGCGNTSPNFTQTITVVDTNAPDIDNTAGDLDANLECSDAAGIAAALALAPTATDNCTTPTINIVSDDTTVDPNCANAYVRVRVWNFTDGCGNTSPNFTQTITVVDTNVPVIDNTNTNNIEIECGIGDTQTTLTAWLDSNAGATATDNCGTVTWTNDYGLNTSVQCDNGAITVTFTATDECNNQSSTTATYLIKDTTAPVIDNTAGDLDANLECSDAAGIAAALALAPTATDDCSAPAINIVSDDTTVDPNCANAYVRVRVWNFTDGCDNTSPNFTQTITVVDTMAPILTLPANVTAECSDDLSPIAFGTATATDNCDPTPTITFEDVIEDGACPNTFKIIRTWTATDSCGNSVSADQEISTADTTAPKVSGTIAEFVVEGCSVTDAPVPVTSITELENFGLNITDNCTDNANLTVTSFDTSEDSCPIVITRSYTIKDTCGNSITITHKINIVDTTPPVFSSLPDNQTVECSDDLTPSSLGTAVATDDCGTPPNISFKDVRANRDCPNNYIIARTWTATDECNLTTTHTQVITVQDTTAPVPTSTFEETLNVSCTDIPDAPELTFTDNCSTNITVVFNETNSFDENVFADYEIVRTWTVRDECNNEEVYTQTLQVALDEVITDLVAPDWCYDEGMINMNNLLSDDLNKNGTWELLEGDPAATLNGNIFDPSGLELSIDFLPKSGGIDYKFRYTTTDQGCISITEVTMNVHADCVVLPCGENDITISKAVTPNGDAYNEYFEISGIELCGFIYDVKIFNRWGALIYESDNYQNDWNGTTSSKSIGAAGKVPNGTYYYIIKLQNSGLNPITGPVYLGTK